MKHRFKLTLHYILQSIVDVISNVNTAGCKMKTVADRKRWQWLSALLVVR